MKMVKGTVKFFDRVKGFGFIIREDGERDVYVNIADIKDGEPLADGERVEFDVEQGDRGPRARNVVRTRTG
ncbi:MAG: cold-shock protein [Candidatus Geothermarchaeales archaeon]